MSGRDALPVNRERGAHVALLPLKMLGRTGGMRIQRDRNEAKTCAPPLDKRNAVKGVLLVHTRLLGGIHGRIQACFNRDCQVCLNFEVFDGRPQVCLNPRQTMISRAQTIQHFKTIEGVADYFAISVQAVYQWPEDGAIPRERELELMLAFPKTFGRPKEARAA